MREIRTSGSTRGGALHGPLLLYRSSAAIVLTVSAGQFWWAADERR